MATLPANQALVDKAILHTLDVLRFDAGERKAILKMLKQAEYNLIRMYEHANLTSFSRSRLKAFQKTVEAYIESIYGEITVQSREALRGVAKATGKSSVTQVNAVIGAELAVVYIAPATLSALADSTLIEGAPSAVWWGRQSKALTRKFMDVIRMSMVEGLGTAAISKRVREQVFPWNRRAADAITRSSVLAVSNAVRYRSYELNSSLIKGVKALVTLDNRTTRLCMSRSGMAWNLSDGTPMTEDTDIAFPGPPPWHWSCRTTLTPVLKAYDELSKTKGATLPPRMQSSMDGQVPGDLTYEQWLKTKDDAFQKKVLGTGRYELWKQGKLTLRDLVDQTGRELTLAQLLDM